MWIAALNTLGYWILRKVSCRFPGVARVFLIEADPKVIDGRREIESGERDMEKVNENPLNADACLGLSFFLFNVGLCVFWFAFNYNSEGTVNPAWTDVFG